jgi:hypothetical protein
MINGDDTDRAVSALMMVIAGLAEGIIDHVANTQPDTLDGRVSRLRAIGAADTDIAAAAGVAAIMLERSRECRL